MLFAYPKNVADNLTDSQIKQYLPDGAEFVGWDIDGDGGVDSLPTTLSSDLVATAIYNSNISEIDISTETTIKVGESKTMGITIKPAVSSVSAVWALSSIPGVFCTTGGRRQDFRSLITV